MMIDDQVRTGPTSWAARRVGNARAGRAGFLGALIMLAAQLIWRLNWSKDGVVQAFPEFVVAALSRLTPLSVFGSTTENYGSLAKKSLFVAVLVGITAVGYGAGIVAGRIGRRLDRGAVGRLAAGFAVAAALLLFTLVVVIPIAHLGVFATSSSYTGDILRQLSVTFAIFAVAWALLASPRLAAVGAPVPGALVSRRAVLGQAGWGVATLASVAIVGGSVWRLFNPKRRSSVTAVTKAPSVQDIVATQRARQAHPATTPTPVSEAATSHDIAALQADVALQTDPLALFTQLDADHKITPVLTETKDFYHVSKNLSDPTVDKSGWKLKVTGLVTKELSLSYDDVTQRATTKKITTLCCISNTLNGDLISTAEWTGLPLVDLLKEAGIKDGAVDLKFHCADDYEDSIPVQKGMDPNNLVVVMINGQPLADDHGFPVRLIIPGIYGMKNVKWLERIEVVNADFKGYWESRGWSDVAINQIWARIDQPGDGDKIGAGPFTASGVAAAGDRDVKRVEVSLDDGQTWADATLEPALNPPFTWVRWAYTFDAKPGKSTMRIRATDGAGQVAPQDQREPLPDGATGWPSRRIQVKG